MSTAIDKEGTLITEPKRIALIKAHTTSFILDVLAAIPLELFLRAITGANEHSLGYGLQLNRMLKIHHIQHLFKSMFFGV